VTPCNLKQNSTPKGFFACYFFSSWNLYCAHFHQPKMIDGHLHFQLSPIKYTVTFPLAVCS
jgi:hypothetical protein